MASQTESTVQPSEVTCLGTIIRYPTFVTTPTQADNDANPSGPLPPISLIPFDGPLPNLSFSNDITTHAIEAFKLNPSIWFLRFPPSLNHDEVVHLQNVMQDMEDYRCWASLQWWQEVYRRLPIDIPGSEINERRSRELAIVACQNMSQTPWLQTMTYNKPITRRIDCNADEFHNELIFSAISGFIHPDLSNFAALEPVLLEIVNSISMTSSTEVKTLIMEKHEYVGGQEVVKSYIRMLSFEVTEAFREIKQGKSKWRRIISCEIGFLEYEGLFKVDEWRKHSIIIEEQQRAAAKDFIKQQSIDVFV